MDTEAYSNCVRDLPRAERIAQLNDQLRTGGAGGQVFITRGVQALPGFDSDELVKAVAGHNDFDACNDPHGERDFGGLYLWDAELLWKIDYYAPDMPFGSEDPADPIITQRVLTILLAEEY